MFFGSIQNISAKTWIFLVLSGLATGASWLCYFRALKDGDINKVVPIDKSGIILTIVLAFIFLHEQVTVIKVISVVFIATGTYLMIQKKDNAQNGQATAIAKSHPDSCTGEKVRDNTCKKGKNKKRWMVYAFLSAIFASLTSILGKIGIEGLESNLGTAIRTSVVLIMAWLVVFVTGKQNTVKSISKKELIFICLSGFATGGSWLCYYKALQDGPASVVVPIDKLSIVVTIVFSYIVFHERLSKKSLAGLCMIVAGTLAMLI